jgi:chromosome partitioning protein
MRSIAVINQKGGVGKTTTAVNLSAALAAEGQSVCLIDLDPQAHASLHLGWLPQESPTVDSTLPTGSYGTIYDVLVGNARLKDVACEVRPNLTLIPAHLDLAAAETELAGEVGREMILRQQLLHYTSRFDYLIIDCPPSLGVLTINALVAVREVFLPMQPQFLALHGMSKMLGTLELVARRLNPGLQLTGVVFCMHQSGTRLASEITRDVTEFFSAVDDPRCPWARARVFNARIRRNIRLAEAPSHGQTIFEYARSSNGADDYRMLAHEVIATSEGRFAARRSAGTRPAIR